MGALDGERGAFGSDGSGTRSVLDAMLAEAVRTCSMCLGPFCGPPRSACKATHPVKDSVHRNATRPAPPSCVKNLLQFSVGAEIFGRFMPPPAIPRIPVRRSRTTHQRIHAYLGMLRIQRKIAHDPEDLVVRATVVGRIRKLRAGFRTQVLKQVPAVPLLSHQQEVHPLLPQQLDHRRIGHQRIVQHQHR